jgi:Protein of unknown function (DUF1524)
MKFLLPLILVATCTHQVSKKKSISYNRKDWAHWSDFDKDCQSTRHEILITRSLAPVSMDRKGCHVMQGKWEDYYYPEVHTKPKVVDIDHLIPLKHAHDLGADQWSDDQKEIFANDPDNLVITNMTYNRKKGAKTIAEWLPVNKDYACKYIRDWIRIKKKYKLELTNPELRTIEQAKCSNTL